MFLGTDIPSTSRISGLVVEYVVAIDVTRVRFPADALLLLYRVKVIRNIVIWVNGQCVGHATNIPPVGVSSRVLWVANAVCPFFGTSEF